MHINIVHTHKGAGRCVIHRKKTKFGSQNVASYAHTHSACDGGWLTHTQTDRQVEMVDRLAIIRNVTEHGT